MNKLFLRSLQDGVPLEMIYLSAANKITKRKILVTGINQSTIRAYCYLRKQTRLFKIDRILSVLPERRLG